MKHKMSILFYAKSAKSSKDGLTPIYLRVTIDGQRIELSTSKFVEKSKWNPDAGKVKGLTEEARSINSYLDILKNKVYEVEKDMVNNDIEITAQTFKNKYLGIDENQRNLIAIFEEHNRRVRELIGKEYAENTYKRFVTALSHTKDFLQQEYKRNDISITKIDTAFINDFDFYLRNTRNCNNNSTLKYIRNFGKIVKQCYANGWIERDPFLNYRGKIKIVERVYLTSDELQDLMDKKFKIERLDLVRDIFVFSCFTGLAYIDVKNLTKSHLSIGIDGEKWLFTHRQKQIHHPRFPCCQFH